MRGGRADGHVTARTKQQTEGRNVKSEDQSPLFIQLQLDGQEQHTDNVPNNSAPKWLKDFRFNVESERSTIGVSLNSSRGTPWD